MDYLLDTCAIIWAVSDPGALSEGARGALEERDALVYISPISCAEIAYLAGRDRIRLDRHWKPWFNHFVSLNGWQSIEIDVPIVQEAYSLPETFHADPVDRIITATARARHLTLITADRKILSYPHVDTLW